MGCMFCKYTFLTQACSRVWPDDQMDSRSVCLPASLPLFACLSVPACLSVCACLLIALFVLKRMRVQRWLCVCRLAWQTSRGGPSTWEPNGAGRPTTLSAAWSTATRLCATSSLAKTTAFVRPARYCTHHSSVLVGSGQGVRSCWQASTSCLQGLQSRACNMSKRT